MLYMNIRQMNCIAKHRERQKVVFGWNKPLKLQVVRLIVVVVVTIVVVAAAAASVVVVIVVAIVLVAVAAEDANI